MKILLINKFLYPKGGDAIVTLDTAKLLRRFGHKVFLWGMDSDKNPYYPYKDLFIADVNFDDPGGLLKQAKLSLNMLYNFDARKKIKKFLDAYRPDIVHLHNFAHQVSPSVVDAINAAGIPAVMTMHDYKLVCASYRLLSRGKICQKCANGRYANCFIEGCVKGSKLKSLLNSAEMYLHHNLLRIYEKIDVYISPSLFLKNKLKEMGFKKEIACLPNFVDVRDFKPEFEGSGRKIVYFGRLSQEKGLFTLIEAFENLQARLTVIGDGPIRKGLEVEIAKRGMDNVAFLGYKNGHELKEEIKEAQAVVVPSEWYENNPKCILESFALGKPVIGSNMGGIPELVRNGEHGIIFEAADAKELREALLWILENRQEAARMGRNARSFVESEFSADKHYGQLMEIYGRVVSQKKR